MKPHCWKDRRTEIEEMFGWGSAEWAETYQDDWKNGSCMLMDKHEGPHEYIDDSEIGVTFR